MFEPSPSPTDTLGGPGSLGGRDRRPSRDLNSQDLPKGVYGVGVKQSLDRHGSYSSEEEEEEVKLYNLLFS